MSIDAYLRARVAADGRCRRGEDAGFAEVVEDRQFLTALRDRCQQQRVCSAVGFNIGRFKLWYAIVRVRQPSILVETPTHDCLSSAVRPALPRNAKGSLTTIDLPVIDLPPSDVGPGWLVPEKLRARWPALPRMARTERGSRSISDGIPFHSDFNSLLAQTASLAKVLPGFGPRLQRRRGGVSRLGWHAATGNFIFPIDSADTSPAHTS